MSTNRRIRNEEKYLRPFISIGFLVISMVSGLFSYLGAMRLSIGGGGGALSNEFTSASLAIGVSIVMWVFWETMSRMLPTAEGKTIKFHYVILVLGMLGILSVSSWWNATAIAGPSAVFKHINDYTKYLQTELRGAYRESQKISKIKRDLESNVVFFKAEADAEIAGDLSQSAGEGPVSRFLLRISERFEGMAQSVTNAEEQATRRFNEGLKIEEEIRNINADYQLKNYIEGKTTNVTLNQRAATAEKKIRKLQKIIIDMQINDALGSINREAQNIETKFIPPSPNSTNGESRKKQQAIIDKALQRLKEQGEIISHTTSQLFTQKQIILKPYETLAANEAVFRYGLSFIPSWAAAITLDLFPALIILILVASEGQIRDNSRGYYERDND